MHLKKRSESAFLFVLAIGITILCLLLVYVFLSYAQPVGSYNMNTSTVLSYYYNKLWHFLPYAFLPITMFTFLILWSVFKLGKQMHKKSVLDEIQMLVSLDDRAFVNAKNEDIAHLFAAIKQDYQNQITEMKQLSSYVSHEQKNELAILKVQLSEDGDEATKTSLTRLQNNIEDILTLCDVSESLKLLDSAEICATVCDTYKKTYPNLYFNFDEEANLMMYGKERWLRRAISNLLHNAIKFGNGNKIEVSLTNCKQSIQIVVRDKGIGMDEQYLNDIMHFGYQISYKNNDGYGIGLNLVHHVCKLCGGIIWIESEKGNGTSVILSFPQAM